MITLQRQCRNSDTQEVHSYGVQVKACDGGFTYQVLAETPTIVFPTADAAADAYAVFTQRQYDNQIIQERARTPAPRCHYCGQETRCVNGLGAYQCQECS